jgi:hypothetical protein
MVLVLTSARLISKIFFCNQFGITQILRVVSHSIVSKVRGQLKTWQEWTVIAFGTSISPLYSVKHVRNTNFSGALRLALF